MGVGVIAVRWGKLVTLWRFLLQEQQVDNQPESEPPGLTEPYYGEGHSSPTTGTPPNSRSC